MSWLDTMYGQMSRIKIIIAFLMDALEFLGLFMKFLIPQISVNDISVSSNHGFHK